MARTGLATIRRTLATLERQISRYEHDVETDPKRKARTRHLIQLGGVVVKHKPDMTVDQLERIVAFQVEIFSKGISDKKAGLTAKNSEAVLFINLFEKWKKQFLGEE